MSSVTDAELNAAAQKLIEEANAESEAALAEYERDCLSARFRLLERGTYRSSILQDSLNELRAAYDKRAGSQTIYLQNPAYCGIPAFIIS